MSMSSSHPIIPTEPIGSIPRPRELVEAIAAHAAGLIGDADLAPLYDAAVLDTIAQFEATGSPVIADGEQRKNHNFASYCVDHQPNFAPDGFKLQFVNHYRVWPRLVRGPLRYGHYADADLAFAMRHTQRPVKQAVIAPSAVSLFYPVGDIDGYPRERFIADLLDEHEKELRACLAQGAHTVQVDFTEGRLAVKLDPSGGLLAGFIDMNNLALRRLTAQQRRKIGIHTCPGGDRDSTHSADADYADLLPLLFGLDAGSFFIALAREPDRPRVLRLIREYLRPHQRAYVGVIDPLDARIESPEEVCERVLEAAQYIPLAQLGTTDDCGFAPFCDDVSTSRETAFAKIAARVAGTALAAKILARTP